MNSGDETERLRAHVQQFTRSMGLLQVRTTPCGQALSVAQAHTLMFLVARSTESPTQRALATHLRVDKSTVTRVVAQLRARGLVQVAVCGEDRRAKLVSLTDEGQQMGAQVDLSSRALFADVLERIGPAERAGVIDAIRQLSQAIERSGGEP